MFASLVCKLIITLLLLTAASTSLFSQTRTAVPQTVPSSKPVTHADTLRGEYGRYRANNDLLFYHLDIRVDPEKKFVSGKNRIRFKMLKDDTRIQLDLYDNLKIDEIVFEPGSNVLSPRPGDPTTKLSAPTVLRYSRDSGAVLVDFPKRLKAGRTYTIDFHYSGTPQTIRRFGGFPFSKYPAGRPCVFTACEGDSAS